MLRLDHGQSDPARGQSAPYLAMREKRNVSIQHADALDEPVGAGRYLRRRFTVGATVTKEVPARSPLANVHGSLPLVVAVIPLLEVRLNLRSWTDTC
jgi:hypothetical protein